MKSDIFKKKSKDFCPSFVADRRLFRRKGGRTGLGLMRKRALGERVGVWRKKLFQNLIYNHFALTSNWMIRSLVGK